MTSLLKPIRFDVIGAGERTRAALAMAFSNRARGICEFATGEEADAVIVDLDGVGARAEWSRYRHHHPDRPSVLMTAQECTVPERAIVLIKPIRIEALMSAVDDVRQRISSGNIDAPGVIVRSTHREPSVKTARMPPATTANLDATVRSLAHRRPNSVTSKKTDSQSRQAVTTAHVGAAPGEIPISQQRPARPATTGPLDPTFRDIVGAEKDVNCDDPEQMRMRFFDPEGTIVDWVRRAVARSESIRRPVNILVHERELITVSAADGIGTVMISEEILKANCTRRFVASQIALRDILDEQALTAMMVSGTPSSIEALLWRLALWTFQGRLPAGTPINERVYLRRWPNLTRLLPVPDAMRISALLVDQPLALPRIAEALSIPQRHVFAFYSAACMAGLASQAKRESDKLVATPVTRTHVEHGFINRVVDRLKQLVA
jgi:hypothetical protein